MPGGSTRAGTRAGQNRPLRSAALGQTYLSHQALPGHSYLTSPRSILVEADPAVLIANLCVEGMFLEWRVGAWTGPPVGYLQDFPLGGLLHDLFPERISLLPDNVLQVLTLQIGMGGEHAIRSIGAEYVEVTVLEAALALVEHLE